MSRGKCHTFLGDAAALFGTVDRRALREGFRGLRAPVSPAKPFGGFAPPFPLPSLSGASRPRTPRQEAPAGLLHLRAGALPQTPY